MTDSEVPLDLAHAIENAESGGSGISTMMELHPPENWHDCPDCGNRLHGQSVIRAGDELIAVTYSCDCLARWVWERSTDELHYRGEMNVVSFSHPDETDS